MSSAACPVKEISPTSPKLPASFKKKNDADKHEDHELFLFRFLYGLVIVYISSSFSFNFTQTVLRYELQLGNKLPKERQKDLFI